MDTSKGARAMRTREKVGLLLRGLGGAVVMATVLYLAQSPHRLKSGQPHLVAQTFV